MSAGDRALEALHPEVWAAICQERSRQNQHIELIASENYVSEAVMAATGSVLTNKYAEGYPGKRYYGGCANADAVETLAIERAKALFGADYVNVQPHSGSQANAAVFLALLEPGDTVMGLDLADGGHLTHGSCVNFSGKIYRSVSYHVGPDGRLDRQAIADVARRESPKLIIAGYSAYSREVDWQMFREIADEVGAYLLADMAHIAGLVATGLHPSPLPYADVVTSTTHKTLRGPRGGLILSNRLESLGKKLQSGIFPGSQGGPLMHVIAAKAVAFAEALEPAFTDYQRRVLANARALAQTLQDSGYRIVSGGTDNHLMLVDLRDKPYSGKQAERWLEQAFMTANKNAVPGDQRSPFQTSGLRLGTPALTTRGFGEAEARQVGQWIAQMLDRMDDPDCCQRVLAEVASLCARFPVYS